MKKKQDSVKSKFIAKDKPKFKFDHTCTNGLVHDNHRNTSMRFIKIKRIIKLIKIYFDCPKANIL